MNILFDTLIYTTSVHFFSRVKSISEIVNTFVCRSCFSLDTKGEVVTGPGMSGVFTSLRRDSALSPSLFFFVMELTRRTVRTTDAL